jgi:hypothetical protein
MPTSKTAFLKYNLIHPVIGHGLASLTSDELLGAKSVKFEQARCYSEGSH